MFNKIKNLFRPIRDVVFAFSGFLYDFVRFVRYAGYRSNADDFVVRYRLIKVYHAIEKSLSFRQRRDGSGWGVATELMHRLTRYESMRPEGAKLGFHAGVALKVLDQFQSAGSYQGKERKAIEEYLSTHRNLPDVPGGARSFSIKELQRGMLESPEDFFFSRYSIRDYSSRAVDKESIERAVRLAAKSPSACNRQAWHVYFTDDRREIDLALSHQSGNRGFGQDVPCLLLITADLRAFDNAGERYQHWIDGGMFAMSIIYALHSIGIGSCCLNWSKGPVSDRKLRRCIDIPDEESLIMMLAVGYPSDNLKVCESPRDRVETMLSRLSFKAK